MKVVIDERIKREYYENQEEVKNRIEKRRFSSVEEALNILESEKNLNGSRTTIWKRKTDEAESFVLVDWQDRENAYRLGYEEIEHPKY